MDWGRLGWLGWLVVSMFPTKENQIVGNSAWSYEAPGWKHCWSLGQCESGAVESHVLKVTWCEVPEVHGIGCLFQWPLQLRPWHRRVARNWSGTTRSVGWHFTSGGQKISWLQPLLFSEVTFLLQPSGWCWFIGNIVGRADFWTSSLRSAWFGNLVPGLVKWRPRRKFFPQSALRIHFPPNSVLLGVLNAFLRCPPWCWLVCPPSPGLVSPCLPFVSPCLPLSPIVSHFLPLSPHVCLCWMVCPPSQGLSPLVSHICACVVRLPQVLSPLVSHCLPTYVCLCWMACSPSRGLVSPCLRLSPIVSNCGTCVPVLEGVFAFPRSCLPIVSPRVCACVGWCVYLRKFLFPLVFHCLPMLPIALIVSHCLPLSPHMCACVGWCVRLPEVCLCWMVCPHSRALVSPCLPACFALSPHMCACVGWCPCLPACLACLLACLQASLCAPWEGGHAILHRHTYGETMGDKRRQDLGKADAQHRHTYGETMGDKRRQDLGKKADAQHRHTYMGRQWETRGGKTSERRTHNTGTHVGRQWETRVDKTLRRRTHHPTNQQGHTCGETREDQTSGRWTGHPTKRNKNGDKGRQGLGKANTHTHHPTKGNKRGGKTLGRRTHASQPSQPTSKQASQPASQQARGQGGKQASLPAS